MELLNAHPVYLGISPIWLMERHSMQNPFHKAIHVLLFGTNSPTWGCQYHRKYQLSPEYWSGGPPNGHVSNGHPSNGTRWCAESAKQVQNYVDQNLWYIYIPSGKQTQLLKMAIKKMVPFHSYVSLTEGMCVDGGSQPTAGHHLQKNMLIQEQSC